jgi:hypothetical protein
MCLAIAVAESLGRSEAGGYLGWSVFGRAASWARAAIHASYSGVPRRGGTPAGSPPIQCGMSARCSPGVLPAQDDSATQARPSSTDLKLGEERSITGRCQRIVAIAVRNHGGDAVRGRRA